jgi:hypothetical protein
MVVHTYNPSMQEVEARGLQVQSQPLNYKKKRKEKEKQLSIFFTNVCIPNRYAGKT